MGELVALKKPPTRGRKAPGPMPERFTSEERRKLLTWAAREGFTYEEVGFGVTTVRDWWETRQQPRADWVRVVMRAMREGWALRGFRAWQKRRGPVGHNKSGEPIYKRTRITEELIERLCR